jgi:hypothetical protein
MKRLENNPNDLVGMERFSRRFADGVEILEYETMRTIRTDAEEEKIDTRRFAHEPRLVVDDAISRSKLFVAKSRSQLGEVDTFLRSVVRPPLKAK